MEYQITIVLGCNDNWVGCQDFYILWVGCSDKDVKENCQQSCGLCPGLYANNKIHIVITMKLVFLLARKYQIIN